MHEFDLFFRYAGATLLLVQIALMLRDQRDLLAARLFAPFALAQAFEQFSVSPMRRLIAPEVWLAPELLSRQLPILLWWFSLALFDEDFRLRRRERVVGAIWLALSIADMAAIAAGSATVGTISLVQELLAAWIALHVAWRLYRGLRVDLIENRRRLRLFFAAGILGIFLFDVITDLTLGDNWGPIWYLVTFNGLILALAVAGFLWIMRVERSVLRFEAAPVSTAPKAPDLSPAEKILKAKLDAAIGEKIYLDPELSIGKLAEALDAPEHQVRALINRALGHRNFRAFLNEHRLNAAKATLADPAKAATPILTIAMESGFNSLAPFNRAFKEATGETPSAWRTRNLAETA